MGGNCFIKKSGSIFCGNSIGIEVMRFRFKVKFILNFLCFGFFIMKKGDSISILNDVMKVN